MKRSRGYGTVGYGEAGYGIGTLAVSAAVLLAPISDLVTGAWLPSVNGATLASMLDESSANSADYIYTVNSSSCEIKLNPANAPLSTAGHVLRYRLEPGSGSITIILKSGSTTVATWVNALTGIAQDIENTLSPAQAGSITDYTNLSVIISR